MIAMMISFLLIFHIFFSLFKVFRSSTFNFREIKGENAWSRARCVCVCVVCVLDESTQVDEKQLLGR
jgi:hypothetical protein